MFGLLEIDERTTVVAGAVFSTSLYFFTLYSVWQLGKWGFTLPETADKSKMTIYTYAKLNDNNLTFVIINFPLVSKFSELSRV